MNGRPFAIGVTLLFMAVIMSPFVSADSNVRVDYIFEADPSGTIHYTKITNLANFTASENSSYNTTWKPFFVANSDLNGTTVTPFTQPMIVRLNSSTLQTAQRTVFSSDQIISGSSVSLWRAPIGNLAANSVLGFQLWRSDSATNNLTSLSGGTPTFSDPADAQLIYAYTGNPYSGLPWQVRFFNVTVVPDLSTAVWVNLSSTLKDVRVDNSLPTTNFGGGNGLEIAMTNGTPATPILRSYYEYSFGMPVDSFVLAANLSILDTRSHIAGTHWGVYGSLGTWNESTITWNNQPGVGGGPEDGFTTPGDIPFSFPPRRINLNVTMLLQSDLAGHHPRGFVVKYVNEIGNVTDTTRFASMENSIAGQRPTLWALVASPKASFHFVYVKAFAPIFPNKNYFAVWQVLGAGTQPYELYYTANDVTNDGAYRSYVTVNAGSTQVIPVDLDESVVFLKGMAHGIAGITAQCSHYNVTCTGGAHPRILYNVTIPNVVFNNVAGQYGYLNAIFPVVSLNPGTGSNDLHVNVTLHDSLGGTMPLDLGNFKYDKTSTVVIVSANLTLIAFPWVGHTITRADFELTQLTTDDWYYLTATTTTLGGSVYATVVDLPNATSHKIIKAEGFGVYGYFSVDHFFYNNTALNIILVPVQQPDTDLGIWQLYQSLLVELAPVQTLASTCTNGQLRQVQVTYYGNLKTPEGSFSQTIIKTPELVDCIIQGVKWLANFVWDHLPPFLKDILYAVGNFIWKAISFVISAIQWFLYWGVKFLSLFVVLVVFSIVFLAPGYIGKSFYEWVKAGYDIDVLKANLREGWEKIWPLMYLLGMMAIIGLSAISAVLPG